MKYFICIEHLNESNPNRVGYILRDMETNMEKRLSSNEIKEYIKKGEIEVLNYYVSTGGRLIERPIFESDYFKRSILPKFKIIMRRLESLMNSFPVKWTVNTAFRKLKEPITLEYNVRLWTYDSSEVSREKFLSDAVFSINIAYDLYDFNYTYELHYSILGNSLCFYNKNKERVIKILPFSYFKKDECIDEFIDNFDNNEAKHLFLLFLEKAQRYTYGDVKDLFNG